MRARQLKPGFFKNEDLAECSPWARLVFAGLWTMADRSGRLEDRPKRIKAEILPFDDEPIGPLLEELERWGFIKRYAVDGLRLIWIPKFSAHQNPHKAEKQSGLPAHPEDCYAGEPWQVQHEHGASTVQAQCKDGSRRASSPIPSSPIPSSLPSAEEGMNASHSSSPAGPGDGVKAQASPPSPCPVSEIIEAYHAILPERPAVRFAGKKLTQQIQARWREDKSRQSVAWWERLFRDIRDMPWLMGQGNWSGANLGWIAGPENLTKILNGQYRPRAPDRADGMLTQQGRKNFQVAAEWVGEAGATQ